MKKTKMKKIAFVFVFVFCIVTSVFESECFAENIVFSADSMKGTMNEKSSSTLLQGNTWIKTSKIELKADSIEISGENYDKIIALGNVQGTYIQSNLHFTCENLEFDQKTGIVLLKEKVTLEDPENNVIAKARIIEYNQKTDVATLQINVELTQNDSVCTGTLGIYNKGLQKLELTGQPKIVRNKDVFAAQEIVLNLKTEEITLDGKVRGTVENVEKDGGSDDGDDVNGVHDVSETDTDVATVGTATIGAVVAIADDAEKESKK